MTKSKAIIDHVVEGGESRSVVDHDGTVRWYNAKGRLHRIDGPAVKHPASEWTQAFDEWWVDGRMHRLDGPAVDVGNGYGEWRFNGKLHRIGGPAVEFMDYHTWWVNGREFTEDEYYRYVDQDTGDVLVPPGKKLTSDDLDDVDE